MQTHHDELMTNLTPKVGWNIVEFLYERFLTGHSPAPAVFGRRMHGGGDRGQLFLAWNPDDDSERSIMYRSSTHESHSDWMKCIGSRPFVGKHEQPIKLEVQLQGLRP
jgi:hypothetical protein